MATLRCGTQICLARRSQQVATSRGLWSVVTGYLEPGVGPLEQAYAELEEELGIRRSVIRLAGQLEPVPLNSPASAKEFLVHPFLFECDSLAELVLNWENDEVQWAEPSRLESADCVGWQLPLVRALLANVAV
jgi:ribose 1,5-bisphosphate isomerase